MLHLNQADAPSELTERPEGLCGSRWVVDRCWAPSQLCLNTKGPFWFAQCLGAGAWAFTGAGGSVESKGKAVSVEFIHGAKAAERALPEPSFPHVGWGKRRALGMRGAEPSPPISAGGSEAQRARSARQPRKRHLAAGRRL